MAPDRHLTWTVAADDAQARCAVTSPSPVSRESAPWWAAQRGLDERTVSRVGPDRRGRDAQARARIPGAVMLLAVGAR
jgi:hypothetical protein